MLFTKSAYILFIVAIIVTTTSSATTQSMVRYHRATFINPYQRLAVSEIAVPSLPDIAAVQLLPNRAHVVLYNPALCQKAGRILCEFYRYHEYGHIVLKHTQRQDLTRQEKEAEADRWAAQHAPLPCVIAAYRYFSTGQGGSLLHGTGRNRAARMISRLDHPI